MSTPAEQQMTDLAKQMAEMAKSMSEMALSSQKNVQLTEQLEHRQKQMQEQLDHQQLQLTRNTVLTEGKTMQLATKEDWAIPTQQLLTAGEDELVSQKQCAEMIQKALNDKVAPILHATVGTVVQTCSELTDRVKKV